MLKGALLMLVWLGETIRPTRDADLLGLGDLSAAALEHFFGEICAVDVEPDGMVYLPPSIRVAAIRPEDAYGGQRATLQSRLGGARLGLQVDVGIGDAVTPEPVWLDYPSLLALPRARLRAYRPETAIAEKFHAMTVLGAVNSRMRDFFDIYVLAERERFDGEPLAAALRATFERRRTPLPAELPFALTPAFSALPAKQAQWRAFLNKNDISAAPEDLAPVTQSITAFLGPVLESVGKGGESFAVVWSPKGPWR